MIASQTLRDTTTHTMSSQYDDEDIFDLDETIPERYLSSRKDNANSSSRLGYGDENISLEQQIPTMTGFDLSLVTPNQNMLYSSSMVTPTGRRTSPGLAKPILSASVNAGDAFFKKQPIRTRPKGVSFVDETPKMGSEIGPGGASLRRRSVAKYDIPDVDDEGEATSGPLRRRQKAEEAAEAVARSPYATSLPIQIPSLLSIMSDQQATSQATPRQSNGKGQTSANSSADELDHGDTLKSETASIMEEDEEAMLEEEEQIDYNMPGASIYAENNPITNPFATATMKSPHRNGFRGSFSTGGVSLNQRSSFMGNPFENGPASKHATKLAEAAGDVEAHVGGLNGTSGYDPSYVGSLEAQTKAMSLSKSAHDRGQSIGSLRPERMSFMQRMILEEMMAQEEQS
jgi:hypothetical protein